MKDDESLGNLEQWKQFRSLSALGYIESGLILVPLTHCTSDFVPVECQILTFIISQLLTHGFGPLNESPESERCVQMLPRMGTQSPVPRLLLEPLTSNRQHCAVTHCVSLEVAPTETGGTAGVVAMAELA